MLIRRFTEFSGSFLSNKTVEAKPTTRNTFACHPCRRPPVHQREAWSG